MSNPPVSRRAPDPNNNMGIAGFVVSIVGIVSCGLLSPVGLVLSWIGMYREPKGLAIAGFGSGSSGRRGSFSR